VTEFWDCFSESLKNDCSAKDMQTIQTRFMPLLQQFNVTVDYICRDNVDGNAQTTFTKLNKKLSYCCDSRSYCMQEYDRLKQLLRDISFIFN